jgi:DNA transposition AAA+ family ATPase
MSEFEIKGKPKLANVANVRLMLQAVDELQRRPSHLPGLGVMYGPSGYGKSLSATAAATHFGAVHIEVKGSWTKTAFLKAVALELGIAAKGQHYEMIDAIGAELAMSRRTLLVDEADAMIDRGFVETAREIHMVSGAPVVLIGEEALRDKLRRFERIHNRVLVWAGAVPATVADAKLLAGTYLDHVTVADDLLKHVVERSGFRPRRIVTNLHGIQRAAVNEGIAQASRAWWAERLFDADEPPNRRLPS